MKNTYHTKSIKETQELLKTNIESGLSLNQVKERQDKYGKNKLDEKKPKSLLTRFIEQITDFMIIVLLGASVISFITGEAKEGFLIIFIVLLNAVIGIIQENKAEQSLQAIKKLSSPSSKVIRDNKQVVVSIEELVPGDIVVIDAGDYIPADIRFIESHSLKVDESALTGEAVPVIKSVDIIEDENIPLGDRVNSGYRSTVATYGRAKGIVTYTGMHTEMGKIAGMLNETEFSQTPLQKSLAQLGKTLALLSLGICVVIFVLGIIQDQKPLEMFMIAVSLAVAAIPEGLPAIVTIVLAIGMQNLVKRKAIMRKLPAVETLGSTNIICSDKTGTLTQNRMTVEKVYVDNKHYNVKEINDISGNLEQIVRYGLLCNDTKTSKEGEEYKTIGDPTETALIDLAVNVDIEPINETNKYKRLYEIPFDSDRKLMTTVNDINDKKISITKGAPDILISRCKKIDQNGSMTDFSEEDLRNITEANEGMAKQALRVLAFGYKILSDKDQLNEEHNDELEQDLIFLGLVGMIDPPREEAKEAIKLCKKAGIMTIMITGDHKITAVAIAKKLGIIEEESEAISGVELDGISDGDFYKSIENYGVYARVSPENKVRIVKTWKSKEKVVAMTGDGVNDAPALKNADIGVAMGITGTEVAKGAADMVLTDDNFATIVNAVKEGRTIFSNIKKSIHYLLSCNIGEIITILLATLLGQLILGFAFTPLHATQILWVNLVTDSLIAIALGLEKAEPNVMDKEPRDTSKSIFHGGLGTKIVWQGFLLGILSFAAYIIGYQLAIAGVENIDNAVKENAMRTGSTFTFMTLALSQLFRSFNTRSEDVSLFRIGIFSNKYHIGAFIISFTLQVGTLLFVFTRNIFDLNALTIPQFGIILLLSITPFTIFEIIKVITYRKKEAKEE